MSRWKLQAGRGFVRDDVHLFSLAWPKAISEDGGKPYPIPPTELDALAHEIVTLLNAAPDLLALAQAIAAQDEFTHGDDADLPTRQIYAMLNRWRAKAAAAVAKATESAA